jgi:hypothetical protein
VPASTLTRTEYASPPRRIAGPPGRRPPSPEQVYGLALTASLLLALLSLPWRSAPAYDPWAWIIWGREIVHLQLHTIGGPTWKPLPVMVTMLLAPFGGSAPALWLLIARAGGLMAVAMGAVLAFRLSGRDRRTAALAAALAAGGILAMSQFFASVAGGESEGLLAAFVLVAILRHLDGRPRQALAFAFAAALIRPETWPFFGLYALYTWWRDPGARHAIVVLVAAIPALWFLPELIGSGSLMRGVQWAQFNKAGSPAFARCPFCAELTGHAWPLLAAPFKVGAALAAGAIALGVVRGRARTGLVGLLAVGAAWMIEEALFTQIGFSGSDRYLLAPVALLVVAGAIGWALVLRERRFAVAAAALGISLALGVLSPSPGPHLGRAVAEVGYQGQLDRDLSRAVRAAGGPSRLLACGPVQTNASEVPLVAWVLGTHMRSAESESGAVVIRAPNGPHATVQPGVRAARYRTVARSGAVAILSRC